MTDTTKTEALRLAEEIACYVAGQGRIDAWRLLDASRELERLSAVEAERDRLAAECEALRRALDPRRWTLDLHDAWNRAIPDTTKAFEDLKTAAMGGKE